MKKLVLALMGIAVMAGSAMAQNYEKNIYGVRAGLNVANMSAQGLSANSKAGFHVAGVYQRLLTSSMPLYLETGLQISQKGGKFDYEEYASSLHSSSTKLNTIYLEVPVMVNYRFNVKDAVTLYPSVGFYYALGIGGKYKETESGEFGENIEYDAFGSTGPCKRSDIGMRFSATADWKHYSFSLGYEFGFVNVVNNSEEFEIAGAKIKTNNFFISVGYKF